MRISKTDLRIQVKPLFQKAKEVFFYTLPPKNEWRRQSIDLNAYSQKFVTLEFESSTKSRYLSDARTVVVSNPMIVSERQFPNKPVQHIFIITADALRADHLGCYGYKRPTSPSIDLFSKDAVLFENAIAQGPATLPSTAALFTSVYGSVHKTDVNTSRLPSQFMTLPEMVSANGYMTAGFVQNEFLNPPHGLTGGFQWYLYDRFGFRTEERLKPALQWIQDMREFPTFLFFHMLHPHSPYTPPPDIASLFHVSLSPLASSNERLREVNARRIILPEQERQQLISLYDAETRHLDNLFGEFIQHLKKLNIYDDSLIVFLSDHGEGFQEHGRLLHGDTVYQNMIHVPLLIKFPSSYNKGGLRIAQYVETMDLTPTLLEFCHFPSPGFLQGQSLMPLINGSARKEARAVFSEVLGGHLLAIIKDGFKYIENFDTRKEELYDLKTDYGETMDLSRERPDLIQMFRKEQSAFFTRASEWQKTYIGSHEGEHITLDEKQTEELRALGYVQ